MRHAHELFKDIPDTFNTAARFLFCEGGVYEIDEPPSAPDESTAKLNGDESLDPFMQLVIFRVAGSSTTENAKLKELVGQDDPTQIKLVNTKEQTYQVTSVDRPTAKDKITLQKCLKALGQDGKVKPAGTMALRPSLIEHAFSNVARPEEVDFSEEPTETFIIDDEVLAKIEVGMKMELVVCELNIGIRFIKEIWDVRVSFDTFLPQTLMLNWKDPVANERPAPSIHDPSMDEKVFDAAPFADDD
jgi:hypothetical protein